MRLLAIVLVMLAACDTSTGGPAPIIGDGDGLGEVPGFPDFCVSTLCGVVHDDFRGVPADGVESGPLGESMALDVDGGPLCSTFTDVASVCGLGILGGAGCSDKSGPMSIVEPCDPDDCLNYHCPIQAQLHAYHAND